MQRQIRVKAQSSELGKPGTASKKLLTVMFRCLASARHDVAELFMRSQRGMFARELRYIFFFSGSNK